MRVNSCLFITTAWNKEKHTQKVNGCNEWKSALERAKSGRSSTVDKEHLNGLIYNRDAKEIVNNGSCTELSEVKTENYKIVPRSYEPYVDIYDKQGNSLGFFLNEDLKI